MENASKALLMAGAILIAMLVIVLGIMLFANTRETPREYHEQLSKQEVEAFNSNFTKYLEKDLTVHDVVTIYNFNEENEAKDIREKVALTVNGATVIADTTKFIKDNTYKKTRRYNR